MKSLDFIVLVSLVLFGLSFSGCKDMQCDMIADSTIERQMNSAEDSQDRETKIEAISSILHTLSDTSSVEIQERVEALYTALENIDSASNTEVEILLLRVSRL